jgi:hypothetical protein
MQKSQELIPKVFGFHEPVVPLQGLAVHGNADFHKPSGLWLQKCEVQFMMFII